MEPHRGKILTFYSHKGGTGRSMALANVACLLSKRADVTKGILAIDWDLEAPGLHWFFRDPNLRSATKGVIDLFEELVMELRRGDNQPPTEELTARIVNQLSLDRFVTKTLVSRVSLMGAGYFDDGYVERVSKFDWRKLFVDAPSLIRVLAELLASKYDYVLIDSRTGFNDISGICTALLPDQLVLVFTPNRQSLIGGIDAVKKATNYRVQSEDLRPLAVFPLPSRIDISEPELLDKWRRGDASGQEDEKGYQHRFEELFKEVYGLSTCDLKNYFDEVQIQHVPRYSYGEEIAALRERGSRLSISRSYAAFANVLASGEPAWNMRPSSEGGAELVSDASPTLTKMRVAKEYLSEERFKLRLHDLVSTEIRDVLPQLTRLPTQVRTPTTDEVAERLKSYEAISNDLIRLQGLLGYWGEAAQRSIASLGPKRIGDSIHAESGYTALIALRWYPVMLLLYSGGIAAVGGRKYKNLYDLMVVPVRNAFDQAGERTIIRAVATAFGQMHEAFKLLPALQRRFTPVSDYLNEFFKPVFDELLFMGSDYEAAFDRFEILFALEHAHRYQSEREGVFEFWGPPGRFAWKEQGLGARPLGELVAESENEGLSWLPLQAGFFAGSPDRFKQVVNGYRIFLQESHWS